MQTETEPEKFHPLELFQSETHNIEDVGGPFQVANTTNIYSPRGASG